MPRTEMQDLWLELRKGADVGSEEGGVLARKLRIQIDRTAQVFHQYGTRDGRYVLVDNTIKLCGKPTLIEDRHVNMLGNVDGLAFDKCAGICGWLATDLAIVVKDLMSNAETLEGVEREYAIAKRVAAWNPEEEFMKYYTAAPMKLVNVRTPVYLNEIAAMTDLPEIEDLLAEIHSKANFSALELKQMAPRVYERLKPLLGGREWIKVFTPLLEEEVRRDFGAFLVESRGKAEQILGAGGFLPCSLETPVFMSMHHLGLFNRMCGEDRADKAVDLRKRFDELGAMNAAGSLQQLRGNKNFSFVHVIEEKDVRAIANRQSDFQFVEPEELDEQIAYMRKLHAEFGDQVAIHVLPPNKNGILEKRFAGQDSVWFFIRAGLPLTATERDAVNGRIRVTLEPNVTAQYMAAMGSIMARSLSYNLEEFATLVERLRDDRGVH